MQGNAWQASLAANEGGLDQGPPDRQAQQFSHKVQRSDGRPAGAWVLAQLFGGGDSWRDVSRSSTRQRMQRLPGMLGQ